MKRSFYAAAVLAAMVAASMGAQAMGKSYMGVNVGTNFGKGFYDTTPTFGGTTYKKGKTMLGVFAGYLWGNGRIRYGLEASGNYYKKDKWTLSSKEFTMRSHTLGVAGVAEFNFSRKAGRGMFGRLAAGADYVFQKAVGRKTQSTDPFVDTYSAKKKKIFPSVAAGLGYRFSSCWGADLAYKHIFGKKPKAAVYDLHGISAIATKKDVPVASLNSVMLRVSYTF